MFSIPSLLAVFGATEDVSKDGSELNSEFSFDSELGCDSGSDFGGVASQDFGKAY